jgi:hypothetical protein
MALIDAFSGNAFRMSSLAEAINVVPNTYGRVRELGLFRAKSLPTTTFYIEFKNGVLNLLNTSPRGGNNPTLARTPKTTSRTSAPTVRSSSFRHFRNSSPKVWQRSPASSTSLKNGIS